MGIVGLDRGFKTRQRLTLYVRCVTGSILVMVLHLLISSSVAVISSRKNDDAWMKTAYITQF